jgi:hypothetical protein
MARKTYEVIEMAVKSLTPYRPYLCVLIGILERDHLITHEEMEAACAEVNSRIDNHTTLAQFLRYEKVMPVDLLTFDPEYLPYAREFYARVIEELKAQDKE